MLGRGRAQKKGVLFLGVAELLPDTKKGQWGPPVALLPFPACIHFRFLVFQLKWLAPKVIHWDAYVEITSWRWNPLGLLISSKTALICMCWRQQPYLQGGLEDLFYSLITQPAHPAPADPGKAWYPPQRRGNTPKSRIPVRYLLYPQCLPYAACLSNWWPECWRNSL